MAAHRSFAPAQDDMFNLVGNVHGSSNGEQFLGVFNYVAVALLGQEELAIR
jgi:hypothetical protein